MTDKRFSTSFFSFILKLIFLFYMYVSILYFTIIIDIFEFIFNIITIYFCFECATPLNVHKRFNHILQNLCEIITG